MKFNPFLAIVFILFVSSCSRPAYYQVADFEELTESHETIAILPFEVYTFGKLPKDVDEEKLYELENLASIALQAEFHDVILEYKRSEGIEMRIDLQHFRETNAILEENGIDIRSSWTYTPEELSALLNVDAVLLARVEKEQTSSDGMSAAIEILNVMEALLTNQAIIDGSAQNKFLFGEYALINHDGTILWHKEDDMALDWKHNTERFITKMNCKTAKCFPY